MSTNDKNLPAQLIPALAIRVPGQEELIKIGGLDNSGLITEMNFYCKLNSFAMKANVTIKDVDHTVLNVIFEPHGIRVTLQLYEQPGSLTRSRESLEETGAKRIFQKAFVVDKVTVLEFDKDYPYKSTIKLDLIDSVDALILNKLITYSNFNLKWDSDEMKVDSTLHYLLRSYEEYTNKLVIPKDIFGVDEKLLKRRFATDCSSPIRDVFAEYIDGLYDTRWYEFLTNSQPQMEIPNCLIAFTNQLTLSDKGTLGQTPYLTAVNLLDANPDNPKYSVPYDTTGLIAPYAKKDYDISIEDTAVDLQGAQDIDIRERLIADSYRKQTFNPKRGFFEDSIKTLKENTILNPTEIPDIESMQDPKYFGEGKDPIFVQINNFDEQMFFKYPFGMTDNKYYFAGGENSFYKDMMELVMKPMIYVSIPFAAWHSPGQEVDLRVITIGYDKKVLIPQKPQYYSLNKLLSGRWKIINTVTNFTQPELNAADVGITPVETLGLTRTQYFHSDIPFQDVIQ